ncbi:hypothetical protein A2U01_0025457, partial [Trifolium medium]|nr:hypothetical protein [Trifolium medium]
MFVSDGATSVEGLQLCFSVYQLRRRTCRSHWGKSETRSQVEVTAPDGGD